MKKNSNLNRPININIKGVEINLIAKKYSVYIIGGWGIDLGDFSVSFKDKETGKLTMCRKAVFRIQAFLDGKRAP